MEDIRNSEIQNFPMILLAGKPAFPLVKTWCLVAGQVKPRGKPGFPLVFSVRRLPKSQGRALRICKCMEDICCPPGVYLVNPWKIPGGNLENTRSSPGLGNCISPGERHAFPLVNTRCCHPDQIPIGQKSQISESGGNMKSWCLPGLHQGKSRKDGLPLGKSW